MKPLDHDGLTLCRLQGELFQKSAEMLNCSSAIFVRRFMNSHAAHRMDARGFLDGSTSIEAILDDIQQEYGESSYGSTHYASDVLYWMGYLYRYWAYTHEIPSARIFRIISGSQLAKLFFAYHSLDPSQAIERILEAKGDVAQTDVVARGVKLLRTMRAKSHFNYAVIQLSEMDNQPRESSN